MDSWMSKDWRGDMEHKYTAREMREYQQWRQREAAKEKEKREGKK